MKTEIKGVKLYLGGFGGRFLPWAAHLRWGQWGVYCAGGVWQGRTLGVTHQRTNRSKYRPVRRKRAPRVKNENLGIACFSLFAISLPTASFGVRPLLSHTYCFHIMPTKGIESLFWGHNGEPSNLRYKTDMRNKTCFIYNTYFGTSQNCG